MKTSQVLNVVAKILVERNNKVGTVATVDLINKTYQINKVQMLTVLIQFAERGYLKTSLVETSKGVLTQFISLTPKACEQIRAYNAKQSSPIQSTGVTEDNDAVVCDGCGKDCTPEEIDNPLGMCESCVAYEVDEQNNGDKDIPEESQLKEGWEVATEEEYHS